MAVNKPSIPKGTRDFSPDEMVRRNYIFDTIRAVFKKYGYQPIETPAMENTETLMGKYGEEGDRLIFRILNSGEAFSDLSVSELVELIEKKDQLVEEIIKEGNLDENKSYSKEETLKLVKAKLSQEAKKISEKALRYDLTVPFARYVVQHQNEITFPFKRYQIQPVWRADRPQKGRYREFFQCDADVIGSNSPINELELVQMIDEVFAELRIPVTIKINNRKLLQGLADICGCSDKITDLAVSIDKLDKVDRRVVMDELIQKGFSESQLQTVFDCLFPSSEDLIVFETKEEAISAGYSSENAEHILDIQNDETVGIEVQRINCVNDYFFGYYDGISDKQIEPTLIGQKGAAELITLLYLIENSGLKTAKVEFDPSLARGLNYYTGAIFEVKANAGTLTSSITGGGRYDDLTGVFGLPNMSGVGISFGADRIYDVLNELNLYPESVTEGTRLLFINQGGKSEMLSLQLLKQVREANIAAEIYPDKTKWEKQAKYVDAKKIPFTATVEEDSKITLKYKSEGKWQTEIVSVDELIAKIK
ncbi:MAG: histidine--tRNA ligase [Bacteroidota bacterium]|nr:histidine--tRNA ligase [Bacteroidota bacterium]